MADEVEIGNVGGNGVASEVTLLRLASAVEKMSGGGASGKKAAAGVADLGAQAGNAADDIEDLQDASDKATKSFQDAGHAAGKLSRSLLGAAGNGISGLLSSFGGLAKEALMGGESMSDFTRHIPIVGSLLGGLTGIFDQNLDSFRQMSNSGAVFGEGLNGLRNMAASAGIPLGEFSDIVAENSQRMTYFGGGVANGTVQFAKLAGELRTGPGRALMGIGYTAQDLNESLIDYAEFSQRQARAEGKQAKLTADGAANYLETVDQLAAITGKRRDQIKEEMNQVNQDSRSRAAIARMGEKEQLQFAANLSQTPDALADALKDMADGVANTPLAQGLLTASDTFRESSKDIQNMSAAEYSTFMVNVRKDLDAKSAGMNEGLDAIIASGSGYGQALDIVGTLADKVAVTEEQALEIAKKKKAEEAKDAGQKGFSNALREIRTNLMSAFSMGPDSPLGAMGLGLESFTGMFTKLVASDGFKSVIDGLKDVMTQVMGAFKQFLADFTQFDLKTALFGGTKEVEGGPGGSQEVEVAGLFGNLMNEDGPLMMAFQDAADWISTNVGPVIGDMFSGMISNLLPDWDTLVVGALAVIGGIIAAPFIGAALIAAAPFLAIFAGISGTIAAITIGFTAIAAMFSWEFIKENISDAWNSITGIFTGITDWWDTVDLMTPLTEMWDKVTGFFTFGEEGFSISALFGKAWDLVTGYFSFAGEVWMGIGGLFDAAWTKVTGWMGFGDKTWSLSELMSDAWNSVTGFFSMDTLYSIGNLADAAWETVTGWFGIETTFSITSLFTDAWTKVTEFLSFGEEGFSISALFGKAWELVTGWFSFATDTAFSIAQLGADAWKTVTGWFGFGDGTGFSISQLATDAWKTVTGFFGFGDSTGFSISQLATDAWATVTGFFSFGGGKEGTGFSISQLATDAWGTVKSFFSFDNFEFPSISSLFDNIWDKLTGFFDFDFKLPSFKSFLPKWLGGEGESLADADVDSKDTQVAPDSKDMALATTGISELEKTQAAMQSFASLPELTQNLDSLKKGLDIDNVRTYTTAMEDLVKVLAKLNDELGKDNYTGPGLGTNAGSVVSKMDTIGSGGGNNSEQLNNTMLAILSELQLQTVGLETTAKNTKNIVGSNLARSGMSNVIG